MSTTRSTHRSRAWFALATIGLLGSAMAATPILDHPAQAQVTPKPGGFLASFMPKAGYQRYIVQYRDGADVAAQATLLRSSGADVLGAFTRLAPTMAVSMTPAAAQSLANDPRVLRVEADAPVYVAATESPATWGLDRIDQRALPLSGSYSYDAAGAGVTAYVIDTGLNLTHTELTGRVGQGWDFVNNDADPTDCNGHGTHVSGTIAGTTYGVAKAATVVPVRVLDCNGSGYMSTVIAGLDWVAANAKKPAVANLSLGGGASATLDSAIDRLVAAGVTVVVAAGNSNADACNTSPARAASAITVGATSSNDGRASYSNFGTCLDLFAPGSSITSSWIGSDAATATISGTSMASPHVAGAAAVYLSTNPAASPAAVTAALTAAATPEAVTGAGAGSPNLLLFSGSGNATPPTTTSTTPTSTTTSTSTTTPASTSTTTTKATTTTSPTTTTKAPTTTVASSTSTTKVTVPTSSTSTTKAPATSTSTTTTTKAPTTTTTTTKAPTTTTTKPGLPSAPTNVAATPIAYGARVTWTIGANGGSALTRQTMRVYYVTASGALSYVGSASVPGAANAVRLTGLVPGAGYVISLTATNAVGTSPESAKSNAVTPTR